MTRHMLEITVCAEQSQVVADAKLREERVDRSELNSGAATHVSQCRGLDVIVSIGNQQR